MPLVTRISVQGNVYKQSTEPSNWENGDIWVDTDNGTVYVNVSGTATQIPTKSHTHTSTTNDGGSLTFSTSIQNMPLFALMMI